MDLTTTQTEQQAADFVNNDWVGGKLLDAEGQGSRCVITLERANGAQLKRHLFHAAARKAITIERGQYVLLKGTIYKVPTEEGRSALRHNVQEIDVVSKDEAAISRIELSAELLETPQLRNSSYGKYSEVKIRHAGPNYPASDFEVRGYGEVAKNAAKLQAGTQVLVVIGVSSRHRDGSWIPVYRLKDITAASALSATESDCDEQSQTGRFSLRRWFFRLGS